HRGGQPGHRSHNKNLEQNVKVGKFRQDLYFRLNVFPIWIPPLRERREDIHLLVEYFLNKYKYEGRKLPSYLMDQLVDYDWPGNVRELKNVLERAMILSDGKDIEPQHVGIRLSLPGEIIPVMDPKEAKPPPKASNLSLEEMEKEMIVEALKRSNGNKTEAAKALHITRRMLYSRMKKYNLL
ncbi:MAG: helix-turn-helix domain-containing protein, partial [Candidatus Zixiibacteriota bacterium]